MEAILVTICVASVVAFISLLPKGSNFSQKQYEETQKEIQKIVSR